MEKVLMAKHATTEWNLRRLMFERGMYKTNDILEPLHEHGIDISREQLFRLVTKPPVRLRVDVIGALCSILECAPNDLFTIEVIEKSATAKATGTEGRAPRVAVTPIRFDVTTRG
jgi:DNA-binding Xre family transcriptional regulator